MHLTMVQLSIVYKQWALVRRTVPLPRNSRANIRTVLNLAPNEKSQALNLTLSISQNAEEGLEPPAD